ncbi:hypothetical protein Tco_0769275 [Tanacetum coccineum]|uniref:Uncharacterized protein n=1 Tax=Tanacetum coccineum TaxID=301880 RepID=A0ABQ4Z8Y5_9ASTR
MDGVDIEDLTTEQYLELTQNHAPSVAKADVPTRYRDHLSPRHKSPDPPLDAKTNPYFQASLSPIHPKITKTQSKHSWENEVIKEREQSDQGLANIRAEINVTTREVSLGIEEDRVKIKMNKQECNFTTAVSEHLNERPTSHDELSYGAGNISSKTHWCEHVRQEHEKGYTLWASCDPYHEICDGGGIPDKKLKHYWKSTNDDDRIGLGGQTREKTITGEQEGPEKCGESKTRAIIKAMINKLPEEWFSGVSKDKNDLEGIIDYLEPTLYDGFIDHNDESYK